MKLIWTLPAVDDLDKIHSYIAKDSYRYASILIEKIIYKVENLKNFPLIGRVVPEFNDSNVREIFVHPYRIIYRTKDLSIDIVAVIHQARDLSALRENL